MLLALASSPVTCNAQRQRCSDGSSSRAVGTAEEGRSCQVWNVEAEAADRGEAVAPADGSTLRDLQVGAVQCRGWVDGFLVGSLAGQRLMGSRVPESIA